MQLDLNPLFEYIYLEVAVIAAIAVVAAIAVIAAVEVIAAVAVIAVVATVAYLIAGALDNGILPMKYVNFGR
jgi:hypothetical protein